MDSLRFHQLLDGSDALRVIISVRSERWLSLVGRATDTIGLLN